MWQRQVTRRRFLGCTAVAAGGILLPAAAASRLAPAALGGQASPLRAGAAVADITPPVGASLKGPIAGNGVVKAIHDPLRARCLALDDGRVRLAICVCDATMIWQRSMDRAKRLVEERTGLPAGSILISASHSHAAPRIIGMVDSPIDNQYRDYAERQIANGYLPTPEQHALGGYTTWPAVSSYLEIGASSRIRDHLLRLLGKASEA